jgi:carbamoyltransferase|tara:strand:+ start:111 stop:1802 length:1692 start_codon:yes stop_codon:yes gene_type:complete
MKVLGINGCGWLNIAHDASAVFLDKGKLKWAVEEERFIRQKRAYDKKPFNAIKFCLEQEEISLDDVDIIAFSWDWSKHLPKELQRYESDEELLSNFFPKKFFLYNKKPKILRVEHHLAHASSTFRCSGFERAAILVVDGQGEYCSSSIWAGEKNKPLSKKWSNNIEDSLGFLYSAACKYIGMRNGDEGKMMGLAPYGKPKNYIISKIAKFRPTITKEDLRRRDGQMKPIIDQWIKFFEKEFGSKDSTLVSFNNSEGSMIKNVKFTKFQWDFAASVQRHLEIEIVKLAKKAAKLTDLDKLCLSGGVALNCIANSKIIENQIVEEIYVQPASNDAGTAIGAALEASFKFERGHSFDKVFHAYLGPEYSNKEVKKILDSYKIKYKKFENISKKCAELIWKGEVIAWFQGRMEFGPRALGNRSILANPKIRNMWTKVNGIKNRELWRPFAPSILSEKARDYFEIRDDLYFMIVASKVKKDKIKNISAVVHKDKTSRPHSVNPIFNKKYYDLIKNFERLSGIPLVLNTSFNDKGEPLVCTPKDAIRTFFASKLNYLVIGDFLIEKDFN